MGETVCMSCLICGTEVWPRQIKGNLARKESCCPMTSHLFHNAPLEPCVCTRIEGFYIVINRS